VKSPAVRSRLAKSSSEISSRPGVNEVAGARQLALVSQALLIGLLLLTAALYAPSLHYGFIWDDPLWYGRVVDVTLERLLLPNATFHFYRPGELLLNALFARADGTFPDVAMHAFQIGVHLVNIALVWRTLRELRRSRTIALGTAVLFALYPLSHQAIVWAAPQQPSMTLLILLTLRVFSVARQRGQPGWAALGVYVLALSIQENALFILPFIVLWEIWHQGTLKAVWRVPSLWGFGLLSAGYLLLWVNIPRQMGITSIAFEPRVGLYLLQGLAFPVLGFPAGFPGALQPYVPYILLIVLLWLTAALLYRRQGWILACGLLWYGVGMLASWAGLRYSYANLSPRQFYPVAPAVAALWTTALLPPRSSAPATRVWRGAGGVLLALILCQSLVLLDRFNRAYAVGTTHLRAAVDTLGTSDAEMLVFVNFPDRYTFKREPYPLGYWGVTLAPVVTPLEAFAEMHYTRAPTTLCLSVPALDYEAREVSPYRVDMRGEPVGEDNVYRRAVEADGVYLTVYKPDGTLELRYAGKVTSGGIEEGAPLASFGDVADLLDVEVRQSPAASSSMLEVTLHWKALRSGAPTLVAFAHVMVDGDLVAQDDGIPGRGLFPLQAWRFGDVIEDERSIELPATLGADDTIVAEIRVGIYDWLTQVRLPVQVKDHRLEAVNNALLVKRISLP